MCIRDRIDGVAQRGRGKHRNVLNAKLVEHPDKRTDGVGGPVHALFGEDSVLDLSLIHISSSRFSSVDGAVTAS